MKVNPHYLNTVARSFRARYNSELVAYADVWPRMRGMLGPDRWPYIVLTAFEQIEQHYRRSKHNPLELSWLMSALEWEHDNNPVLSEPAKSMLNDVFYAIIKMACGGPLERSERVSANSLGIHRWPGCARGLSRRRVR